jgi:glucose/arabinose dehydrogenase
LGGWEIDGGPIRLAEVCFKRLSNLSTNEELKMAKWKWCGLACIVLVYGFALELCGQDVETTSLPVKTVRAFPNLEIDRPILFDFAPDGTDRIFVASQYGVIYVMPNDASVSEPSVFLDIKDQVTYYDEMNEEGLLGMAFHPKYKQNGKFYLYYTSKKKKHLSMISEFTVSKTDPNRAEKSSEKEIMRIQQPYWNHNGATLCFDKDGFMYIGLGDGGAGKDPHGNGQNVKTLLGSILRIDVDKKEGDLAYGIPADNPFVGVKEARPEIYAKGVRNIWRMAFDSKTGLLYAADVGQDQWEEVNIIAKGGNYGWNAREGRHRFDLVGTGADASDKFVEPIWEYGHDQGKSITGGLVYRGKKIPELDGVYLFADYVSGRLWGIRYDEAEKKVVGHYLIEGEHFNEAEQDFAPVITFGQDSHGEVYFTDSKGRFFGFEKSK